MTTHGASSVCVFVVGNDYIPQSFAKISKKAKNALGININDYVLYDYYSVFDDKGKNVLTKYENIIMQMTEEEANKFLNGEL
jgi:effector-binding domain-containing protein